MAMTPEEQAAYERGYEHGESSQLADWVFALDGVIPDDVDVRPSVVAAWIRAHIGSSESDS